MPVLPILATVPKLKGLLMSWRAWLLVAVLAAFAALAGLAYVRGKDIQVLEAQNSTLAAKLDTAGAMLADQNLAVQALKRASDEQERRAQQAAKAAERALGASNARLVALRHAQVPPACPGALEWLRAEVSKSATAQESRE